MHMRHVGRFAMHFHVFESSNTCADTFQTSPQVAVWSPSEGTRTLSEISNFLHQPKIFIRSYRVAAEKAAQNQSKRHLLINLNERCYTLLSSCFNLPCACHVPRMEALPSWLDTLVGPPATELTTLMDLVEADSESVSILDRKGLLMLEELCRA